MLIDVAETRFPLAEVFTIARGSKSVAEVLTVLVHEGGFTGRGECVPYRRYGESLSSAAVQISSLPEFFSRKALQNLLPAGAARNAVDCALWDLEAKSRGLRVWELAGLPPPLPRITAFTISLDSPERMKAAARRHAHRPLLKIKLGTADDMVRLEAVRSGAPRSVIIVDANEGWTIELYKELAPHLLRLGVALVEQPLPVDNDGMLAETERLLPVCADESSHDRGSLPALKGKYDMINIKLDKTGGLTEALALRKEARSLGFRIMAGCMVGSSLAMAPAVIVAQEADITDLDGPLLLAEDRPWGLQFNGEGVHPPAAELWG
jgi:L-Ala-D/L-Glu epimerase